MRGDPSLAAWLGRTAEAQFTLDPWPAAALTAALDRDDPPGLGQPLPPFWHHLYGHGTPRASVTGPDGHPSRGGFLPPVPLPRRMWAGGRLRFERPLLIGQEVTRRSAVKAITPKQGRQGALVFVFVEHVFSTEQGLALVEEHDIVYREAAAGSSPAATGGPDAHLAPWRHSWQPDEVLLFRYSALTYTGHRIHYDHRYVTEVEAYPGLIVHGPLLATFMLDLVRRARPDAFVRRFSFRALAPVFVGESLTALGWPEGDHAALAIARGAQTVMRGEVELGSPMVR